MRLLLTNLIIFLLATGVFAGFDCQIDACFGQPEGCIPGQNCRFVFKFDDEGNLDLYLRDFVDPHAYAAFPLGEEINQTYTYLICLPHAQKRMRAIAKLGQPIIVSEKEMARTVRKIGENDFVCSFPTSELTDTFQRDKNFFITTGQFVDNLVINDGEQLYSFDAKHDSEEDADYEVMFTEPISGTIKRTSRLTDDVYTGEDSKQANDAINVIEKIVNNKKDGSDLEEDIESVKKQSSRRQQQNEEEVEERIENGDEEDFEQAIEKITRRPTRGNRKSTSRPRQDQNEEEEEGDEDEDWEEAAKKLEKKERKSRKSTRRGNFENEDEETRPSRRRSRKQYEEDEDDEDEDRRKRRIPKRKSRRDEDDEEEEDEENEDEDEDDAAAANFDIFLFSSFVIIAFGFIL